MKQLKTAVEQMENHVTLGRAIAADPVMALRVWRQGQQARRLAMVTLRSRPRRPLVRAMVRAQDDDQSAAVAEFFVASKGIR